MKNKLSPNDLIILIVASGILLIAFVFFFDELTGNTEEDVFVKAAETNTSNAYEEFLKEYPSGDYAKYANKMLTDFKNNNVVKPIEAGNYVSQFCYHVFYNKRDFNVLSLTNNGSPFYSEFPEYVTLPNTTGDIRYLSIVSQAIETNNCGKHVLSEIDYLGGSLRTLLIIDNATDINVDLLIETYLSRRQLSVSIPSKSHYVIEINLIKSIELFHLNVTRQNTKNILEDVVFPIAEQRNQIMFGWYVYNINKENKYRVTKEKYNVQ